ncbi:MAG: serine/threonine protein phosphatase [Rhodobacteraceae bacterium]|nr:serine/threonine protein phosphatase [Paracoccaceae bacterium]
MTDRIYALGDIHGQLDQFHNAHRLIAEDRARVGDLAAQVVHVGDLTDRGPDSRGVLEALIAGQAAGKPWVVLKGNHDRLFYRFMDDPTWHDPAIKSGLHWLNQRLGGATTLASYGVSGAVEDDAEAVHRRAVDAVIPDHLAYLRALPLTHRFGDLFFAHAGIRPGVALSDQVEDDLVWIRNNFVDDTRDHGVLVVHGHTVIEAPTHYGNRVNLDGGAAYGRPLVPAVFEGRQVWTLTDEGRVPLRPA